MSPSAPSHHRHLALAPHPEGGSYRETFRSHAGVATPPRELAAASEVVRALTR